MSFDFDAFEKWLKKRGARVQKYQPRTIIGVVKAARRTCLLHEDGVVPEDWPTHPVAHHAVERMHAFLAVNVEERAKNAALIVALDEYLNAWVPPSKVRKNEAHSIDDESWMRLCAAFRRDESLEARVLDLIAATGMRISDVLRIERKALLDGVRTGSIPVRLKGGKIRHKPVSGAPLAWGALAAALALAPDAANITQLITRTRTTNPDSPAYGPVRAALLRIGKAAGVDGRLHLHRLRRTLVVQALRDGHDIALVQKAFDHECIVTTAGYADEAQEDRVAALQLSVAKRFGEKKE